MKQHGFNHPMVKVKETLYRSCNKILPSFNHPMVKVKDALAAVSRFEVLVFQPPYGES